MNAGARFALGAGLAMAAALGINRFAYTPLLPPMLEHFGFTLADAGDIASVNYLGYMLGALFAPRAVYAANRTQVLAVSLAASVASTALLGFVSTYAGWLIARFLGGVASAYCLVLVTTMLAETIERTGESHVGNLHFSGVGLGIVTTALVAWTGLPVDQSWLKLAGIAAVVMLFAWQCFRPQLVSRPSLPSETARRKLAGHTWLVILAYGCFGYGYVVAATFLVAIARMQSDPATEYVAWIMVGLAAAPSVWLWQRFAQFAGLFRALLLAYLAEAVGVVMAGFFGSMLALSVAGVLLGGTFAAITALGLSYARRGETPATGARVVGYMTVAFAVGQWIGPAVSGRIAHVSGDFMLASLIASAFLMLGVLLLIWAERKVTQ